MTDRQQLKFSLDIPATKIYTVLKWVVVINILFLLGTWVHHNRLIQTESVAVQYLLAQFNFAKENIAAAWYSSMLFFSSGIIALLCFWADMQRTDDVKGRILNFGWIVIAGIFIMLSFDEMGSFHEMIGETALFKKAGGGSSSKGGGWFAFYGLIALVAIFMITFFVMKFKGNKVALLLTVIGVLLFASNPFQEKFEIHTWRSSADPSSWHRPAFFLLLEEGSEIFASFCFLYSFTRYAMDAAPGIDPVAGKILKLDSSVNKNFIFYLGGLAFLLGSAMLLIHMNAWNFAKDDNGIPQNWPPSAVAFFAFISSLYLYFKFGTPATKNIYLLIALTSLMISVYFGSNIYGYRSGIFGKMKYVMLAITVVTGLWSLTKLDGFFTKLFIAGWVLLIIASVVSYQFFSSVFGYFSPSAFAYLAMVSLVMGLFYHFRDCYFAAVKDY